MGWMMMDKVKGFDIPVDDMRRACEFYKDLFGWEMEGIAGSGGDFHSARTVSVDEQGEPNEPGGINGGLYIRGTNGLTSTFLEIKVSSIDAVLQKVALLGGLVVRDKSAILDIAYFAVIKDSEGNHIGLWEDR
jgi:predicted enzyme related to lactoylglutathione lyase